MKKKIALTVVIAFVLMLCTAAFALAEQVDLIRIALKSEERTLNPHTYATEDGYQLLKLIYDPLLSLDENLQPVPWLAEEYTVSADGLIYTFKIHSGVKWHDGQPLTAEDVKFTYDFLLTNLTAKTRFATPSKVIAEINVIDELTVEMKLKEQSPEFLLKPISEMGILPKHIWENVEDAASFDTPAVGSGAYKLAEMKEGEYYKLEANPDYTLGSAVAKQLYLAIIKDPTAMFTALKSGGVDVTMQYLSAELISDFRNNSKFKTVEGGGFISTMLYFNCERYPFNLTEFRTALIHAANTQELIDVVMLGAARKGSLGYVHPDLANYSANTNEIPFDLAKANEILDGLNFVDTNGDGIREMDRGDSLNFEMLVYSTNPQRIRIAEFLRDWYKQIGVGVTIRAMDMDAVDALVWPNFDAAQGREFDMVVWGWGASTMNSAQRLMENMYSDLSMANSNIGAYKNAELDKVFDALRTETDLAKRNEYVKQVQDIYSRDPGAITFYYIDLVYAYNAAVYDNWTFQLGSGIVNNLSLIDRAAASGAEAAPAAPAAQPAAPSNNDALDHSNENSGNQNFWIIGAIIVAAIVFMLISKSKSKKKDK